MEFRKKYPRTSKANRDFRIPDAAVRFTAREKNHFAALEVELGRKERKRLEGILKHLGTSAHSVKAQILVALIAYLLVMMLKYAMKSDISIPDAMAVVGTLLLLKEPLSRILGHLPRVTRHPSGSQLTLDL